MYTIVHSVVAPLTSALDDGSWTWRAAGARHLRFAPRAFETAARRLAIE